MRGLVCGGAGQGQPGRAEEDMSGNRRADRAALPPLKLRIMIALAAAAA